MSGGAWKLTRPLVLLGEYLVDDPLLPCKLVHLLVGLWHALESDPSGISELLLPWMRRSIRGAGHLPIWSCIVPRPRGGGRGTDGVDT